MQLERIIDVKDVRKFKAKKIVGNILIYAFLIVSAIFVIIPFYWMVATALRSANELGGSSVSFFPKNYPVGSDLFPEGLTFADRLKNFKGAIDFASKKSVRFFSFYVNTIVVGLFTTAGTILTTILAAFAFARLNFKGKDALFTILLATMMIPGEIFVITNFATISTWKMTNTFTALILPFVVSVFYIFFLRQTFKQIPNEMYLAAKVDGTGDFKYLWKVMVPMAKSTITSILILSMMGTWNAYVWPNLVASGQNKFFPKWDMLLVSNGLLSTYKDIDGTGSFINYQMAAATMVTVPLIIIFLILRKQIMSGISRSGIKG